MSSMLLGGATTNGLKWMAIDACHSLYHVNWKSMQNAGQYPYNGNLHLLLGVDSDSWASVNRWWYLAQYMNWGTSTNYSPLTIRNAWYASARAGFGNGVLPSGTVVTFAVAGASACFNDALQTNQPPSGGWIYDTPVQVYP